MIEPQQNTPQSGQDNPQEKPFVEIKNISKRFGSFTAVDNISLDVYKSELFCLLGGSGSGKSTLLRMLAGFETPTSGQILIDGVDMCSVPPWKRPVNMMFQSYALFPHMNVAKNIAYGLKRDGLPKGEINDRVHNIIDMVQLGQFATRKPHQLSGGQRQRVALARALVKSPKLLLLDEPLGALDKKLREETQFELMNIQDKLGITFMVVTHDQEEAMTLSTRIGVMNHGKIMQVSPPRDMYEFPNSKFVAEFIGSVNIFEGLVEVDEPDHVQVRCPDMDIPFYASHGISCSPEQTVWIALRPEKIRLSHSAPEQSKNYSRGTIAEIAYMGGLSIYKVRLPSGKHVRVTQPNFARHMDEGFDWDDEVYISWGATSAVVLTS